MDGVPDEKSTPSVPVQRSLLPFNAYLPDEPIEGLSGVVGVDGVAERVAEQPFALFQILASASEHLADVISEKAVFLEFNGR